MRSLRYMDPLTSRLFPATLNRLGHILYICCLIYLGNLLYADAFIPFTVFPEFIRAAK